MSAPENPPVFPIPEQRDADGNGLVQCAPGMTLRDWVATPAPPPAWGFEPVVSRDLEAITDWSSEATAKRNAEDAEYEMAREIRWRFHWADAMLAARTPNTDGMGGRA